MNISDYGPQYREHLMEQYKLYVEMADRTSARRDQSNRLYVSLLSGLLVLASIVANAESLSSLAEVVVKGVAVLVLALSAVWWLNIRSYRQLNSARFRVIHEMEVQLPFAVFQKEWERLQKAKYSRLTRVEQQVPLLIGVGSVVLLLNIT